MTVGIFVIYDRSTIVDVNPCLYKSEKVSAVRACDATFVKNNHFASWNGEIIYDYFFF